MAPMHLPPLSPRDAQTGLAVAETLFHRWPILWWQVVAPSAAGRAEITRMVAEKQKAAIDGMFGAQAQAFHETVTLGWLNPLAAWKRVATAAFRPAARTVRANARRLRGR